ncbi:uncharacterized protein BJ171DRAFT_526778, partial [Polychytrium aggregatum]|uniref:uncharacterized protein n=1 Tax=Polychytrium aggregatum TaxID=110093 RepID=UPI0022FE4B0C
MHQFHLQLDPLSPLPIPPVPSVPTEQEASVLRPPSGPARVVKKADGKLTDLEDFFNTTTSDTYPRRDIKGRHDTWESQQMQQIRINRGYMTGGGWIKLSGPDGEDDSSSTFRDSYHHPKSILPPVESLHFAGIRLTELLLAGKKGHKHLPKRVLLPALDDTTQALRQSALMSNLDVPVARKRPGVVRPSNLPRTWVEHWDILNGAHVARFGSMAVPESNPHFTH